MVNDTHPDYIAPSKEIQLEDYMLQNFAPAKLPERYLEIVFIDARKHKTVQDRLHGQLKCDDLNFPFARTEVMTAFITEARTLVSQKEAEQQYEIIELSLDVSSTPFHLKYQPGDTVGILPSNPETDVDFVLQRCQLEEKKTNCCAVKLKTDTIIKSKRTPAYVPKLTTPQEILRDCLNLRVTPKKQLLRALAECCSESQERIFLNSLASKEGSDWYNRLILEHGYNFLDILKLCPSCYPSLALLIEHLPRLLPRPYSIACSPLSSGEDVIKIIFSIRTQAPGVTTHMMQILAKESLRGGENEPLFINLYLRDINKFRYTEEDLGNDCILIGVGTGVAPFLGFLEHRMQIKKMAATIPGKIWLFTGSKTEESAFGRNCFKNFKELGFLDAYYEAFSRIPNSPAKHVQDLLLANSKNFIELLMQPKTRLYVCADGSQVSKSIEEGIKQCVKQQLLVDEAQADELIKTFRKNGKYCEDLWN